MIEFDDVAVWYGESGGDGSAPRRALRASFIVPEGELVLVVGPTGSGKSTLLRCVNGLVPHFSGGTLRGRVDRRRPATPGSTGRATSPTSSASSMQDPVSSFVTDTVEEEIAYGMEAMGVDGRSDAPSRRGDPRPARARRRAAPPAARPVRRAAAAGRDRRACSRPGRGSWSSTSRPPRSTRSPPRRSWPACTGWCTTSASRVVVAEHRLERVIHHADRVLLVDGPGLRAARPR